MQFLIECLKRDHLLEIFLVTFINIYSTGQSKVRIGCFQIKNSQEPWMSASSTPFDQKFPPQLESNFKFAKQEIISF